MDFSKKKTSGLSELVFITARKRSCGKVMFLQVSVILFTGGVPGAGGVPGPGGPGPGGPGPGGVPGPGGCLVLGRRV